MAVLLGDLQGRGVQRSTLNLLTGALHQGIPCDLILSARRGELMEEVPPGVRVIDLAAPRALRAVPALIRYLRQEQPWAMIVAEDHTNVLALSARWFSGHPRTITVSSHVMPHLWASGREFWTKEFWLSQAVRVLYPLATGRIAVAGGLGDEMAECFNLPRDSISVIPNPVVTPSLLEAAEGAPPHPWLEPGGPPVILGVGSLTRIKGFDILLEAFTFLRGKIGARLMVLGQGTEGEGLQRMARELGIESDVTFPGFDPDPAPYFSHADLFVLSSRSEGFGNVLVEAMACGCPVVSTDCSSGPREILEGGVHGPLVPPEDPMALAEAMLERLTSPRGATNLQAAASRYHVDRILVQYRKILRI